MIAGAAQNRFNQNMLDLSLHAVTPSLPLAQ
jgi:hypothetical protein